MHETTNSKPIKVLVIENNNDHWISIDKSIRSCFSEALAVRVASAEEALRSFERYYLEEWKMPNLILLGLHLPTLDEGLTLLKHVKTMALCKTIPIVALSASTLQADITEAYRCGVSSYCLKPSRFEEWITLFGSLRDYWLNTITLPPQHYPAF